jgi:hypothetical protein
MSPFSFFFFVGIIYKMPITGGSTTGSIRTLRVQSGTNGSRTLYSILASGASSAGAGSFRRAYAVSKNKDFNLTPQTFFGFK